MDNPCRGAGPAARPGARAVYQAARAIRGSPALAGKSTLNRLELTPKEAGKQDRYKKIVAQTEAMDTLLVEVFVESHAVPPKEIVIDVDTTDDPLKMPAQVLQEEFKRGSSLQLLLLRYTQALITQIS